MSEKLEKYLEEISRYLGTGRDKQEILLEIKSHIMDKIEQESGKVTDESLERIIVTYGNPREVAEKYMAEQQIIAPAFKGHLLRYAAILFTFHFGLILLALLLKTSLAVLPFFYVPRIDSFQALFYFPMAFFFDLGLVGLILYFVTQSRKNIRLPWPRFKVNWQKVVDRQQRKPRTIIFAMMISGYAVLVYVYARFGTLFFKSLNPGQVESLFSAEVSAWYSLGLLAILGIGILATLAKFFTHSEWIDLLRSGCQLVILGIVINRPMENAIEEFFYFDLQLAADLIVAVIAVLLAVDFVKSLILLGRRTYRKKTLVQ
jgi:hypothetical protein